MCSPEFRRLLPAALLMCALFPLSLHAQLVVKLTPQTVAEFDRYAAGVEKELNQRWSGRKPFLATEDQAEVKATVRSGELFIRQMNNGHPVSISNGLIHDWLGAVYIPHVTIEQIIRLLEDYDRHQKVYPSIAKSRLIARQDHTVTGYWRLEQKGLVPVTLDVRQEATYTQLTPGKWKGEAFARQINEVDTGLFAHGRVFPVGEGHGYMWRLYNYWSFERSGDGVLAECRSLSLSRDMPAGLAWAIEPYVRKMPREALSATLGDTRKELTK